MRKLIVAVSVIVLLAAAEGLVRRLLSVTSKGGSMEKRLLVLAVLGVCLPLGAQNPPAAQKKTWLCGPGGLDFQIIRGDEYGNVTKGFTKDQAEWFQKKMAKKYPKVCYNPDGALISFTFGIVGVSRHSGTQSVEGSTSVYVPGSSAPDMMITGIPGAISRSLTPRATPFSSGRT